jgi:hemolysin III
VSALKQYAMGEKREQFNSISHLIGAVAALAGLILLVVQGARQGDPMKIVSFSIYGTTLLLLYFFSTLYHSSRGKAKEVFRKFDHHSIFLLIAGTYTPFTLVSLRGSLGWSIFGVIWGLAGLGIVLESLPLRRRRVLAVVVYLFMGWLCLIALKPLFRVLSLAGFTWLLLGGVFYTAGVVFYIFDKRARHFHGIWHLFVMAGSISHYCTVLFYVV